MTYTIKEVSVRGDKFGERGDATIGIKFDIEGLTKDQKHFVIQLLPNDTVDWRRDESGISLTLDYLQYNPRFDYNSSDPSTWKMLTMDELLGKIETLANKVQDVLPATKLPMTVYHMMEVLNVFSYVSFTYIRDTGNWLVYVQLRRPGILHSSEVTRKMTFSNDELGNIDIISINNLVREMRIEADELSVIEAATKMLYDKIRNIGGMSYRGGVKSFDVYSYYAHNKTYLIEWTNGYDLMQKVEDFDIAKFAEESGHNELVKKNKSTKIKSSAEDKAKAKVATETKEKLANDWKTIQARVREMNRSG